MDFRHDGGAVGRLEFSPWGAVGDVVDDAADGGLLDVVCHGITCGARLAGEAGAGEVAGLITCWRRVYLRPNCARASRQERT